MAHTGFLWKCDILVPLTSLKDTVKTLVFILPTSLLMAHTYRNTIQLTVYAKLSPPGYLANVDNCCCRFPSTKCGGESNFPCRPSDLKECWEGGGS